MTLDIFTDYDVCPMATQQAEFLTEAELDHIFTELDKLNAEEYAYFLAHGEVPPAANPANETEAA